MKKLITICFLFSFVFVPFGLHGQDIFGSNAASVSDNESDSTAGWTGDATITSDPIDHYSGSFSIKGVSTANNGRTLDYVFSATVGQDYTIRIWAKVGPIVSSSPQPAFASWSGLSGFSTTPINATQWTEYVFNVTATQASPMIRAYTSNYSNRFTAGNTIYIDHISIIPSGGDTQAPTSPTSLSSTAQSQNSISLGWTAATDNVGVTGYKVFRDGSLIATLGAVTSYVATGLTASTQYNFYVTALDTVNNESSASNSISVTTDSGSGGGDTQNPAAPTALTSTGQSQNSISLGWTAATDNVGVTGYKVFRGGTLIATLGVVTSYTATGLTASTQYNFYVTALDAANNESSASNTISATTSSGSGGSSGLWTEAGSDIYYSSGNVGIGTQNIGTWQLAVGGKIRAEEVRVETGWADYVFDDNYNLPTLEEVEKHIKEKGHLINIPSTKEVEANGIALGEMNKLLLEKIEELTLYILAQQKEIDKLKKQVFKSEEN